MQTTDDAERHRITTRKRKNTEQATGGGCCNSQSPIYNKLWPIIFLFSVITDIAMPLPKGKKPGQHRDWGWLPILFIICLSAYVYYGYICRIVFVLLWKFNRHTQAIVYLVFFNIFFIMFLISYARIVSKKPGHAKDIDNLDKPHTILSDNPEWCDTCQVWKPDRTHHCRVCGTCVLKMDHHCPWVNGCVGVLNYRYYIQFLFYVTILGIWIFSTTLAAFIQFNSLATFDGIALSVLIVGGILTFILGAFTMSHLWLVLHNRTTIENVKFQNWKEDKKAGEDTFIPMFTESGENIFDQGMRANWIEVMGDQKLLWFLPFHTKQTIDGVYFGLNLGTLMEYKIEVNARKKEPNAI
ncbi:DHHC palmitoyltransferase-domain-containing protein [Pilaira anomala]|nr:DHHC palmitoyltransferase-domain-containing protein [Pilaira anomala]